MNKKLIFLLLLFPSLLFSVEVKQGLLNRLLAPGPLIEGHKKLEKVDCLSCHDAGKGVPDSKCLDCHKEIKKTLMKKVSFHGLATKNQSCIKCHTDHKGRDFDSTKLDLDNFDHKTTGHILHGKHKEIKCSECHTQTRKDLGVRRSDIRFLGATASCKGCHQKDDVHLFKNDFAKKDCNSCHTEEKWKDVKDFDHFKVSKFKLVGKHAEMTCAQCHTPNGSKKAPSVYQWSNLQTQGCVSCHKPFHGKNLSPKFNDGKCQQCHNQNSWKISTFDHAQTGLALKGKHGELACIKCHVQSKENYNSQYKLSSGVKNLEVKKWVGLKSNCVSCHKDFHQFGTAVSKRFGKLQQCQQCHNERSFKKGVNFNHSFDTPFKINGKHMQLNCVKCHVNTDKNNPESKRIYKFPGIEKDNCAICHQSPHLKTFSKKNLEKRCSSCHVTSSWKETRKSGQFNHNVDTRFVLDGKHSKMKCNACHKNGEQKVFKFNFEEKQFCEACHKNVHQKQFSSQFAEKSCLECHSTNSFKELRKFDHSKTNFVLDGKHADTKVSCTACHKPTKEFIIYKNRKVRRKGNFQFTDDKKGMCTECHQNVHAKQFNQSTQELSCTTCHTTDTFHQRKSFDHTRNTNFPLKGFHEKAQCTKCHVATKYNFKYTSKKPMHRFVFRSLAANNCNTCHRDAHKGEFGKNCQECHSESSKWKKTQDFHKDFLLSGVHYTLRCDECHKDQRRLGGMSDNCILCHQKDDRHRGTLPNCKECHKQEFWEVTSFKHSLTSFPLRGSHRVLSCDQCHQNGLYQGRQSECISCHLKDKLRSTTINHNIAGFEDCASCHNQFVFK
ncbi:MAG: hypothetical protein COW00_14565 [Bdellovibrio sp. CG12_big_fil_rev_8_21_14_0_65_39_13]|nr:MAG: hypothetical protein COW78_07695 [Bdellovibrio sp. CG22_combo_CG10-13_8_21_14_all_39_27]PIQ58835.1 MAG: hypothetical protein COW00_14565 [Bdellovibrio sp. CG12_big_fil_rev_8_21_14_0_65_39_13]PIR35487.1 MAG: hypothetical protein COV37_08385 [Bdellovibrio sp. CG11_big_fil_rev_8_21_14_0_20_39_38]